MAKPHIGVVLFGFAFLVAAVHLNHVFETLRVDSDPIPKQMPYMRLPLSLGSDLYIQGNIKSLTHVNILDGGPRMIQGSERFASNLNSRTVF